MDVLALVEDTEGKFIKREREIEQRPMHWANLLCRCMKNQESSISSAINALEQGISLRSARLLMTSIPLLTSSELADHLLTGLISLIERLRRKIKAS